jgi:WD40 repeat protein
VWALAFSPDGKLLASTSHDKSLRLWDTESWKVKRTSQWRSFAQRGVAFSPDSLFVVTAASRTLALYHVPTVGPRSSKPYGHFVGYTTSVAFSPDGRAVAAGGSDATLHIFPFTQASYFGESAKTEGETE